MWSPKATVKTADEKTVEEKTTDLQTIDTSFVQNTGKWCQEKVTSNRYSKKSGKQAGQELTLQSSVLPSTLPIVKEINGTRVMVFQTYDSSRNVQDSSKLVYSVLEDGTWTQPKAVWDTGTADSYADLQVVNGKLVVAWQKENSEITTSIEEGSDALLKEIAQKSEICTAVFNEETQSFQQPQYVTQNDSLDMMPKVCQGEEDVTVTWVRNSDDDMLQNTGINSILMSRLDADDMAGEESELTTAVYTIKNYVSYYENGEEQVAYVSETGDGEQVFNRAGDRISNLESGESADAIANIQYGNGNVYYTVNGQLYAYDSNENATSIYHAGESTFGSNAVYTENSSADKRGFVWSEYDDSTDTSKMMVSLAVEDGFSEPVEIGESTGVICRSFSSLLEEDGSWDVITNSQTTSQNQNNLTWYTKESNTKLELSTLAIDENDVTEDGTAVNYSFENTGDTPISQLHMDVELADGTTITKDIDAQVQPGEMVGNTAYVDLSQVWGAQQVKVSLYAEGQEDLSESSVSDTVGLSDIMVSTTSQTSNTGAVISAKMTNLSTQDANVTLHVYSNEGKVKELASKSNISISAGEENACQVTIPASSLEYNNNGADYVTLVAEVSGGDYDEDNNTSYAAIYKQTAPEITPAPIQTPTVLPPVSNSFSSKVKAPAKTSIRSIKNKKSGKLVIAWKKSSKATGYQVAYATNKKYKSAKKVSSKKLTVTIKKLKKKKTYYVRVRAYKTSSGKKYYSGWSGTKKIKIKI